MQPLPFRSEFEWRVVSVVPCGSKILKLRGPELLELHAKNFKTPTHVIHGQLDYRVDVREGFQLFTTLQRLKVPSKFLYFPDEGHWVLKPQTSQLWYKRVNDWVDSYF